MNDLVMVAQRLYIGEALDRDGELEISMDEYSDGGSPSTWLDRGEILALITHLGKVLDDADEEAMK